MKISAPEGKFLQIQILQNAIVRSPECEKDYLRVLDGPNQMYGPLPGEFHELNYKKVYPVHTTQSIRNIRRN